MKAIAMDELHAKEKQATVVEEDEKTLQRYQIEKEKTN